MFAVSDVQAVNFGASFEFHIWDHGSTVGRHEAMIREYTLKQEQEDTRMDQMNLWR